MDFDEQTRDKKPQNAFWVRFLARFLIFRLTAGRFGGQNPALGRVATFFD